MPADASSRRWRSSGGEELAISVPAPKSARVGLIRNSEANLTLCAARRGLGARKRNSSRYLDAGRQFRPQSTPLTDLGSGENISLFGR